MSVRVIRFRYMGRLRLSVNEAKKYWLGDDPTICVIQSYDQVWALPRVEVKRGLYYVKKLEVATTIEDAQKVYEEYSVDENRPRLLPQQIINFLWEPDFLLEILEASQDAKSEGIGLGLENLSLLNNEELYKFSKKLKFDLFNCSIYRDEADTPVIYAQPSLWTDYWIPAEIAEKLGVTDSGYGIDYEPAEFIYTDLETFKKEFHQYGINVLDKDEDLHALSGY